MNDHGSPEEIERDIERTRADISRTLNDLQQRLSPGSLIGDALNSVAVGSALRSARAGTADFAAGLGHAISRNPLPVLLTGIGIAWLLFSRSRENSGDRSPRMAADKRHRMSQPAPSEDRDASVERADPSRDFTDNRAEDDVLGSGRDHEGRSADFHSSAENSELGGAGPSAGSEPLDTRTDAEVTEQLKTAAAQRSARGIGQQARARTRGAAAAVSDRVGRVSQTLSQGVDRMTGAIRGSGGTAYQTTKHVAEKATSAAQRVPARVGSAARSAGSFIEENPILSGGIAIALGAALALIIPPSRRERQLMGEASDQVKSSVRQAVKDKVEHAKDVAATAAEAAAEAARKEAGGEGGEPADTASAAGETVGEPAR